MKNEADKWEGWLRGIVTRRTPDVIRVILDVVEAGLRNGTASANDVRSTVTHCNSIGAAFRLLPSLGFEATGEFVQTPQVSKHRRRVFVYRLEHRWKAERFVTRTRQHLLSLPAPTPEQLPLAM